MPGIGSDAAKGARVHYVKKLVEYRPTERKQEEDTDGADWQIAGKSGAAEILGMKATTLRSRMERLGVPTRTSKGDQVS